MHTAALRNFCFITLLWILDPIVLIADDWSQWRGSQFSSVSQERGIATKWDQKQGVIWKAPMPGQGGATPVFWKDRIFVTSADNNDLVLLCISTKEGKEIWRQKVTSGNLDARSGEGNSASPSPCTDGKNVWVFFSTGILGCYTIDGAEVWKFDVGDRFGKLDIQFGMTSTPVLDNDGLYLQLIHGAMKRNVPDRIGKVIKLDKATGKTVWEVDRNTEAIFECKHSYASPSIYRDGKTEFLVVHGADCTTGHALKTGQELWRFSDLNGPSQYNLKKNDPTFRFVSSPAIGPGTIIIPTAKDGPTIAIRVDDRLSGDVSKKEGIVKWVVPQTPDVSIPLIVDGLVYNLHKDGRLQCIDLNSGDEIYFERTHTTQHRSSPVYADGKIYLCAKDGVCTVIRAGRKFEVLATNDLGSPISASPVICDGVLYIRTYDHLFAIKG